jgi:hypothetical protein
VTAQELYDAAVALRESEHLLDIAVVVTVRRRSHILWWSKGTMKRDLKKFLRRGVAECFLKIYPSDNCKFRADAEPLPGIDAKRASHLLWSFGSAHHQWEMKLN